MMESEEINMPVEDNQMESEDVDKITTDPLINGDISSHVQGVDIHREDNKLPPHSGAIPKKPPISIVNLNPVVEDIHSSIMEDGHSHELAERPKRDRVPATADSVPGLPTASCVDVKSNGRNADFPLGVCAASDDMENYFSANAHLLDGLESDLSAGDTPNNPAQNAGASDMCVGADLGDYDLEELDSAEALYMNQDMVFNLYGSGSAERNANTADIDLGCESDDSLFNHCGDSIYQTNPNDSFDDPGDFIEVDIAPNPYSCPSSNHDSLRGSNNSSCADLGILQAEQAVAAKPCEQDDGFGADDEPPVNEPPEPYVNECLNFGHHNHGRQLKLPSQPPKVASSQSLGNLRPHSLLPPLVPGTFGSKFVQRKSETDKGISPTSVSGSSHRTHSSYRSPLYSECSGTYGVTSDSSPAISPDVENREGAHPMSDLNRSGREPHRNEKFAHMGVSSDSDEVFADRVLAVDKDDAEADEGVLLENEKASCSTRRPPPSAVDWKVVNNRQWNNQFPMVALNRDILPKTQNFSGHPPVICNNPRALPLPENGDTFPFEHNDLNPTHSSTSESPGELFNVSRQTSTSNFDQDENSFQDLPSEADDENTAECPFYRGARNRAHPEANERPCAVVAPQQHRNPNHVPPESNGPSLSSLSKSSSLPHNNLEHSCQAHSDEQRPVYNNHPHWSLMSNGEISDPLFRDKTVNRDRENGHKSNRVSNDESPPLLWPRINTHWLRKVSKHWDDNFVHVLSQLNTTDDSDSEDGGSVSDSTEKCGKTGRNAKVLNNKSAAEQMLYSVYLNDYVLGHLKDKQKVLWFLTSEAEAQEAADEQRRSGVEKVMIWSEYEAYMTQVCQIGPSACGATAILNVLRALKLSFDQQLVCDAVKTNLRANSASVGEYLISRAIAGATAAQLMEAMTSVTNGTVFSKFFHFYPERDVHILKWLAEWMHKGAVAMVTLNKQRSVGAGCVVPDAWHHQMVYGVGPSGVYVTNPQEVLPLHVILPQLCSPSQLLVRRQDILTRWRSDTDLNVLLQQDEEWGVMNVLGQVVNILREERMSHGTGWSRPKLTTHVHIPAAYRSGITLFVTRDSPAFPLLSAASCDLPIRDTAAAAAPSPMNSAQSS